MIYDCRLRMLCHWSSIFHFRQSQITNLKCYGTTGCVHATSTSPFAYGFGCGLLLVTFARTYISFPVSV